MRNIFGNNIPEKFLMVIIVVLIIGFVFSLFKNIQYPLFWNDEAETAVFAERIIKFGYPKVDDGKNALNLTEHPERSLGIKESIDAWIHLPWAQYYWAVPAAFFAGNFDDFYIKTGILRSSFALAGLVGVLLTALSVLGVFSKRRGLWFLIFFFIFQLLSVSLVLHLREVRSFSLTILFSSLFIYSFVNFFIVRKLGKYSFLFLYILSSFLLLNSFPPIFFSTVFVSLFYLVFSKKYGVDTKNKKVLGVALVASLLLSIPYFIFFETITISLAISRYFNYGTTTFVSNLGHIFRFLANHEFLYLALFIKLAGIYVIFKFREKVSNKLLQLSIFLNLFFILSILTTTRLPYMFDRYIIISQPIYVASLVVDGFLVYGLIKKSFDKKRLQNLAVIFSYSFFIIFSVGMLTKWDSLKGHIYELTNQYKGPMDYIISYLGDNYKQSQELVIATNYAEPVYIYYLNSKVIVGFIESDLQDFEAYSPDIVIPRRGRENNITTLNQYLEGGNYIKKTFPVFDYQVNNIPELTIPLKHLFKTKIAESEKDKLEIYINEK